MKITKNTVVSLTYDLHISENKQEKSLVGSTNKEHPFIFLYGAGGLLPDFEENINGLVLGDKFAFDIAAEKGYGLFDENAIVMLPKDIFQVDGKIDNELLKVGKSIPMSDNEGNHLMGQVLDVMEQEVKMDFNHPLAGKDLHFKGEVVNVRMATAEEISHGHSHDGGHHH